MIPIGIAIVLILVVGFALINKNLTQIAFTQMLRQSYEKRLLQIMLERRNGDS